ncbi:MAG: diguanylate cyclase, partial [Campylobacterota bacterium]|nr:diguanylate cyclase [Campylobacterota bacterium]
MKTLLKLTVIKTLSDAKTVNDFRQAFCHNARCSGTIVNSCNAEDALFLLNTLLRRVLYVLTKYTDDTNVHSSIIYTLDSLKSGISVSKIESCKEYWLKYLSEEQKINSEAPVDYDSALTPAKDDDVNKKAEEFLFAGEIAASFAGFLKTADSQSIKDKLNAVCDALGDGEVKIMATTLLMAVEGFAATADTIREKEKEIENLKKQLEATLSETLIDPVTKIGNKKMFNAALEKQEAKYKKTGENFAVVFFDIPKLTQIGDMYGHAAKDKIAAFVANHLKDKSAGEDMLSRYESKEFAVLLDNAGIEKASKYAEEIINSVA